MTVSPKIELQLLILKGQSIQNRLISFKNNVRNLRSRTKTEIELESRFWGEIADYIVEGIGPFARDYTKSYRIAQEIQKLQNEETSIRITFNEWQKEVKEFMGRISIQRKNLSFPGNSQILIKRFRRFENYIKFETRVNHALLELRKILREDLIFNNELPVSKDLKEILVEPRKPYSAQKILREVLEDADRYIKIIDTWINVRSFDPLLHVKNGVNIQFLCSHTGGKKREPQLSRFVVNLHVEKPNFRLRKAKKEEMHDRWIITDKGIWSLSQSIKDFGRKDTIALIVPIHSKQMKERVESFFNGLWERAIKI